MNPETSIGNPANSRSDDQRAHMEACVREGKCPFCPPLDPEKNVPIEPERWKYWHVWKNPWPYPGLGYHFVLALKRHEGDYLNLMPDELQEMGLINQWAIRTFELPGGGLVMRFGNNEYNGGTLHHLHAHIQVPNRKKFSIAVFYKDEALEAFLNEHNPK